MFACMDVSLKNVCTASLIRYTAYYVLGRKQTTPLLIDSFFHSLYIPLILHRCENSHVYT